MSMGRKMPTIMPMMVAASLQRIADDQIKINFAEPVRAPAPGQSTVFYDEQGHIIGGGKIFLAK